MRRLVVAVLILGSLLSGCVGFIGPGGGRGAIIIITTGAKKPRAGDDDRQPGRQRRSARSR